MQRTALHWEWIVLAAAGALLITQGVRLSLGLYVAPIAASTGVGIAAVSFAMAIAQFSWGAAQPIAGAIADRFGAGRVILAGLLLLALGSALTPLATTTPGLVVTIGILSAVGAGAASFSVVMGAAGRLLPPERRAFASGVMNAGGSFGQFVLAPATQAIIVAASWMTAMWTMAAVVLMAAPLAYLLRRRAETTAAAQTPDQGLVAALKSSLGDRSYLLLHAGFFTCGFHIAFLSTHLPGEIALCGLPGSVASWSIAIIGLANIVGSIAAGWSLSHVLGKHLLFAMYASRAVLVLLYLAAPKTALTFYLFAAGLGVTWLATVPATASVVGKLFGPRYLSTLFGLTLLSHQIGGFFGAYLGGLAAERMGSYDLMWYADAVLAAAAALVNLPIREPALRREALA